MTPILVTGAAGFIGFHTTKRLLASGFDVVGVDNLNAYYDPKLKEARLGQLVADRRFQFVKLDVADTQAVAKLFADHQFERVVHLAAQAGVRYSLTHPHAYAQANLVGFLNILEGCRQESTAHLVYASSSSVYGSNVDLPFSVKHNVDHPVSLYAATKKANELMAHAYSHLFALPTTGLRFFTVYGPWGRPDMALFIFTRAILAGEPIDVYNKGEMRRDFTYIDDIVEGIVRVLHKIPEPDLHRPDANRTPATSTAPYRVYNIGNSRPEHLLRVIELIEESLGLKAKMRLLDMQPGDVQMTYADLEDITRDTGFRPTTPIELGIPKFIEWYREFFSDPYSG